MRNCPYNIDLMCYDVSIPIKENMPIWAGVDHEVIHKFNKSFNRGDRVTTSRIALSVHTGTHVDAPFHCIENGAPINRLDLKMLMGSALLCDLTHIDKTITRHDLEKFDFSQISICLLKTRNSELWNLDTFEPNFINISLDAANYLISCNVSLVGIDYLSLESFYSEIKEVHMALLSKGIPIVEGLDFREVLPGIYYFICLPLCINGAEAAPARAILLEM